jgi:hypothetical protein
MHMPYCDLTVVFAVFAAARCQLYPVCWLHMDKVMGMQLHGLLFRCCASHSCST